MCSYCGCSDFETVGRFMAEHEHIINHLGALRSALLQPTRRRGAADTLAAHLSPHTAAEEVGLFAVLSRDELFTAHIAELCLEHESLDQLVARVGAGEVDLFPALERLLREHIDREDNGLFPASAIHLGGPEWDEVDRLTPPARDERTRALQGADPAEPGPAVRQPLPRPSPGQGLAGRA